MLVPLLHLLISFTHLIVQLVEFFAAVLDLDGQVLCYGIDILHYIRNCIYIFLSLLDDSLIKVVFLLKFEIVFTELVLLHLHLSLKMVNTLVALFTVDHRLPCLGYMGCKLCLFFFDFFSQILEPPYVLCLFFLQFPHLKFVITLLIVWNGSALCQSFVCLDLLITFFYHV